MLPVTPLPAGSTPKGSELKGWSDQIDSLTAPAWTAYGTDTTILTATTTNPTKGNSTWTALYSRAANSNECSVRIIYTIGSTFSVGSGFYDFLLPVAASANSISMDLGIALVNDQGTAYRNCRAYLSDSTHVRIVRDDQGSPVGSGGPGTAWANTDVIRINITYEPA